MQNGKEEFDDTTAQRPPSPPIHTTFPIRGIHPPTFSAFKPRDFRMPAVQAMNHVAWSCDGKKLAAVGMDKTTRVWSPDKSMEPRAASFFSGGHSDDVDYVSWNPTHPELFCTSSQKDRRIIFWDARQSRNIQQIQLKVSPVQTNYSPDGRTLLYVSAGHSVSFLSFGKEQDEPKEQWHLMQKEQLVGGTATFTYAGDALILTHHSEHTLRIVDFPSLKLLESPAAHVGGCMAIALDPRGRYLASGGHDSIVNLFDYTEWICTRTITCCENSINALSFSYDGEYLAIANTGSYIDICAVETGLQMHRVPAVVPSPTVAWHPSKYAIAYCGLGVISLFGFVE